jgi:hypothetical protein
MSREQEIPVGEHKGDIRATMIRDNIVELWFNSPDGDSSDTQHFQLRCASHEQAVKIANRYNRIFNVTLGEDTPYQHLVQSPELV